MHRRAQQLELLRLASDRVQTAHQYNQTKQTKTERRSHHRIVLAKEVTESQFSVSTSGYVCNEFDASARPVGPFADEVF
ncbi:MAG: hypothetical protein DWH81_11785 [Planctomycetota bacterium]|nr:MAG: hypothetical protein DWH81_11785 [Planctomycetota bacterium]